MAALRALKSRGLLHKIFHKKETTYKGHFEVLNVSKLQSMRGSCHIPSFEINEIFKI